MKREKQLMRCQSGKLFFAMGAEREAPRAATSLLTFFLHRLSRELEFINGRVCHLFFVRSFVLRPKNFFSKPSRSTNFPNNFAFMCFKLFKHFR